MITTPIPPSTIRLMLVRMVFAWRIPSAAVGSSISTSRGSPPKRPGNGNGLPLPAGKPFDLGGAVGYRCPDTCQEVLGFIADPAPVHPTDRPETPLGQFGVQEDIAWHIQLITQIQVLGDRGDSDSASVTDRPFFYLVAVHADLTDIGHQFSVHDPEQSGLSRSVVSHQS